MKALFACQDSWELVEDGFDEPTNETEFNRLTQGEKDLLKNNRKKDAKAIVFLYQALDKSVFPRIAGAKTSKEAWQTLKIAYQGMEKVRTAKLQLLRRDFENLNMKESDNIDSFFTHRLSRNQNSSLEQAFKTQMSFGRGRGQGRGNKRGRGRSQNRGGRNSPANAQGRGSTPNQNQGQGSSQQREQHHAQGQRYEKSNVQ
eukprot:PITA_13567